MNIQEKIDQIRREPEHIRLRWVWGSVTFSMLIILSIWFFSMSFLFQGEKNIDGQEEGTPTIQQQLQTLKEQAPSISDLTDSTLDMQSEGVSNMDNSNDFQYPTTTTTEDVPQTSAYSELQMTPAQ